MRGSGGGGWDNLVDSSVASIGNMTGIRVLQMRISLHSRLSLHSEFLVHSPYKAAFVSYMNATI